MNMKPDLPYKLPAKARKKMTLSFDPSSLSASNLAQQLSIDGDCGEYEMPREERTFVDDEVDNKASSVQVDDVEDDSDRLCEIYTTMKVSSYLKENDADSFRRHRSNEEIKVFNSVVDEDENLSLNYIEIGNQLEIQQVERRTEVEEAEEVVYNTVVTKSSSQVAENHYVTLDDTTMSFEAFRTAIFKFIANRSCADCKISETLPKWFSTFYFITLCDKCANFHYRFIHRANPMFVVEIDKLFRMLVEKSPASLEQFMQVLKSCGNEKMNSLLEFREQKAHNYRINMSKEAFIIEKYLSKRFINYDEIDETINYQLDFNRRLFDSIKGASVAMTVYYLFLGANINFIKGEKSILDVADAHKQTGQCFYLSLSDAVHYRDIGYQILADEFEGYLSQIYDINVKTKGHFWCKLREEHMLLSKIADTTTTTQTQSKSSINYSTIMKVSRCEGRESTFEIKWCHEANNSIISAYFESENLSQMQYWLKSLAKKCISRFIYGEYQCLGDESAKSRQLSYENWFIDNKAHVIGLLELLDYCQVNMFGYLNMNQFNYANQEELSRDDYEKSFVLLLETSDKQVSTYFRRLLIVLKSKSRLGDAEIFYEVFDLRKLVNLKKTVDSIVVDMPSRTLVLKYYGYSQILDFWFERIVQLSVMKFRSIEEQYLTKNDIPMLVEKCCTHIELNYLDEKLFYSNNKFLNEMQSKFYLKRIHFLLKDLEQDKRYELGKKVAPMMILAVMKEFLGKLSNERYTKAFDELLDVKRDVDSLGEFITSINSSAGFANKVKSLLNSRIKQYEQYYNVLKRICLHLHLISKFIHLNQMSPQYLASLFAPYLFNIETTTSTTTSSTTAATMMQSLRKHHLIHRFVNGNQPSDDKQLETRRVFFVLLFEALIENYALMFDVNDDYLKIQCDIIQRSMSLRNSKLSSSFNSVSFDQTSSSSPKASSKFLIHVYLFSKQSDKSFTINMDSNCKCRDLLEMAKSEFKLDDSKYWCLYEVFDADQVILDYLMGEKASSLLERIIPTNANLLDTISTWSTFYLCVKPNEIQLELEKSSTNQLNDYNSIDECKFLSYVDQRRSSQSNMLSAIKWKSCSICIQNATIKIQKPTDATRSDPDPASSLVDEFRVEECLVYYGFYNLTLLNECSSPTDAVCMKKRNSFISSFLSTATTMSRLRSSTESQKPINSHECLTLYSKVTKNVYCVNFESKVKALTWYLTLFKLTFFPDSWFYFKKDKLPMANLS